MNASRRNRGLWMVYDYENASRVWLDWKTFSSNPGKFMYFWDTKRVVLPIDLDPPLQRAYRKLLNPYFTPARASAFEPAVRELVSDPCSSTGRPIDRAELAAKTLF
jgi:cytochrome P450